MNMARGDIRRPEGWHRLPVCSCSQACSQEFASDGAQNLMLGRRINISMGTCPSGPALATGLAVVVDCYLSDVFDFFTYHLLH